MAGPRPGPRAQTRTEIVGSGGRGVTFHLRIHRQIMFTPEMVNQMMLRRGGPLAQTGPYLRKVAMNSMKTARALTRKKKKTGKVSEKPSLPGKPPRARTKGQPLKRLMGFTQPRLVDGVPTVMVGPAIYPASKSPNNSGLPVSRLHEFGGSAIRKVRVDDAAYARRKNKPLRRGKGAYRHSKKSKEAIALWLAEKTQQRTGFRQKILGKRKRPGMGKFATKTMRFPARPYMLPAMNKSKNAFTKMFRNSLMQR